jgi:Carboxypeptidase regulatory-like domain
MLKHGFSVSALRVLVRRAAVPALSVLLAAGLGFSQQPATVSGIVKDPSGLVVSSAPVTLKNEQTASESKVLTDGSGAYKFAEVAIGDYTIHVEAPGFKDPAKILKV